MESTPTRPLCSICNKRQVDTFKTSQGVALRKDCSACRRDPDHEKKRYIQLRASREGMVEHVRPLCKVCNKNLCVMQARRFGLKKDGTPYYHSKCSTCMKRERTARGNQYAHHTGYRKEALRARGPNPTCEYCGFEPLHLGQLDVDHIDGNHKNHEPSNLQVLCANCHRLKTIVNKDGLKGTLKSLMNRWDEYREHATKPNPDLPLAEPS